MTLATILMNTDRNILETLETLRATLQRSEEEHIAWRQHSVMMERAWKQGMWKPGLHRNGVLQPRTRT